MRKKEIVIDYLFKLSVIIWISFFVFISTWVLSAFIRVRNSHKDLVRYIEKSENYSSYLTREETLKYINEDQLSYFKSCGPLLKRPFRKDIRLYYGKVHADNHAMKDETTGKWNVKIFR